MSTNGYHTMIHIINRDNQSDSKTIILTILFKPVPWIHPKMSIIPSLLDSVTAMTLMTQSTWSSNNNSKPKR